jgi:hypothetical protein
MSLIFALAITEKSAFSKINRLSSRRYYIPWSEMETHITLWTKGFMPGLMENNKFDFLSCVTVELAWLDIYPV